MDRILIVGGVAAGMKAAATARRRNPSLDILVMQDEPDVSYSACGMPYSVAQPDMIPREKLVARSVGRFRADGIDLRTRHVVEEVDLNARVVRATSRDDGKEVSEAFDQVLFATGARPISPPFPIAEDAPPVLVLRNFADSAALDARIVPGGQAVVIGGGYIGIEVAEALAERTMQVTIVEAAEHLLPNFDPGAGSALREFLTSRQLRVIEATGAREVHAEGVVLANGDLLPADLVICAIGVRPRVELARSAGVDLGANGAIAVDDRMQTSCGEGIFAAGDCAEARHLVSGGAVWYPLGDIANRQGRVAGTNLAGGDARFPGVLGTAIFQAFDFVCARTGLSELEARKAGFAAKTVTATVPSRARYMPGSQEINTLVVFDNVTGRILGAEAYGTDKVDKFIDTLAAAIWGNLSVDDMAEIDLAYAPPSAPLFGAPQVLGQLGKRTMRGP